MSPTRTRRARQPAVSLDRIMAIADFRAALRRFLRHSELVATRHSLTPQRHLLLLMIKGAPDGSERLSIGAAAERLQLGENTTTELVNRAEEAGLVRRERNEEDARMVYLSLTKEGERRLGRVLVELENDREQLEQALRSLTRSFQRRS